MCVEYESVVATVEPRLRRTPNRDSTSTSKLEDVANFDPRVSLDREVLVL
jgi:hypothetical protein